MGPINGGSFYPLAGGAVSEDFGSYTQQVFTPTVAINSFNIYNIAAAANQWTARLNGVVQRSTNANTVNFRTNPAIGWNNTNTNYDYFYGDIAEIVIYDRALTALESNAVAIYLNNKYGFHVAAYDLLYRDPYGDADGDGVSNIDEIEKYQTDPFRADTDGDGLPDGWEVAHGTNPLVSDATSDPDGDGVTNQEEYALGSNPTVASPPDTGNALQLRVYLPRN